MSRKGNNVYSSEANSIKINTQSQAVIPCRSVISHEGLKGHPRIPDAGGLGHQPPRSNCGLGICGAGAYLRRLIIVGAMTSPSRMHLTSDDDHLVPPTIENRAPTGCKQR